MEGYRQKYVDESTGEEIKHWDEASNVHYQDGKLNVPRLNSETVQGAIEELAKRSTNPVPSQGTGSSDTYYLIKADEWGLTKSDHLPIRGKHYVKNSNVNVSQNAQGYDTSITYEQMHNNAWGIERAIQHAYKNGYAGVILERGIYYVIPENISYTSSFSVHNAYTDIDGLSGATNDFLASINIYDVSNFDVNLNNSTICFVVDSAPESSGGVNGYVGDDESVRNPYYTDFEKTSYKVGENSSGDITASYSDGEKPRQSYNINAFCIVLTACKNVTLRNGILRGDAYTRSFVNASEAWQEQTYGITNGLYCYNTLITSMDISGFMGDAIGTGGGRDLILRDDRETIYDDNDIILNPTAKTVSIREGAVPIPNPNYGKYHNYFNSHHHPNTNFKDLAFVSQVRPVVKYTSYGLSYDDTNKTTSINTTTSNGQTKPSYNKLNHYNSALLWFQGPGYEYVGYNVSVIPNPARFCTLSLFIDIAANNLTFSTGKDREGNYDKTFGVGGYKHYYDEYYGNVRCNGDYKVVADTVRQRIFGIFASTGTHLYWPKMDILTYRRTIFPVIYDGQPYVYDVQEDEVYTSNANWTKGTKISKDSFVSGTSGPVLFCEIVKRVYNPLTFRTGFYFNNTIYYFEFKYSNNSTTFKWYDSTETLLSTLPSGLEKAGRQFIETYYLPDRVLNISDTGDFILQPTEKLIRIQCHYDKGLYGEFTLNGSSQNMEYPLDMTFPNSDFKGEYGEAVNFNTHSKNIRGNKIEIGLLGSNKLIVDRCVIHDNFRGGISGGIKDLIIRDCNFYKLRRKTKDAISAANDPTTNIYSDDLDMIPNFRSTTNYCIDIEEGFTSNTEIFNCRFLDKNSLLILSGLNFSFHHNIAYGLISLRNIINTNIHHNVFYNNMFDLDWWKLGSCVYVKKDANESQETQDIAAESFSDGKGNVQGYVDKIGTGASFIERVVNINNNICYKFNWPTRYFWKTIFNINNNTLYLSESVSYWREIVYSSSLTQLLTAVSGSVVANNRIVLNACYFENASGSLFDNLKSNYVVSGTKHSVPLFGNSYNNIIENKGGVSAAMEVTPLGSSDKNICINGTIRLGDRRTAIAGQNNINAAGVELFEGFIIKGIGYIYSSFGDPTLVNTVKNCEFFGEVRQVVSYYPVVKNLPNIPIPTIELSGTSADRYRTATISYTPDGTACYLAYSLDGSNFIYIDNNTTIYLYQDCIVSAIVTRQGQYEANNLTTPIISQVVYVDHYYLDDNNDRIGIEIDDPEVEESFNYDDYPTTLDSSTYRDITLRFVNCKFYKPINVPIVSNSESNNYKSRLTIIFDRCDFTDVEGNCATKIKGEVDSSNTLSGLSDKQVYYDIDTKQYVYRNTASTLNLNRVTVLKFNNCYTNDGFLAHKTENNIGSVPVPNNLKGVLMTQAAYNNLGQPEDDVLYLIEDNNA